jgi:MraZ protein
MISFLGNIDAKVDNKGRIGIPSQFRKILQEGESEVFVLRKDIFQECLTLYPLQVWESNMAEMRAKVNKWNERHQQLLRCFVQDVERLECDAVGRILIPKRYLQMVGIVSDVRFLGIGDVIEIWAKEKLEKPLIAPEIFSREIQELMN